MNLEGIEKLYEQIAEEKGRLPVEIRMHPLDYEQLMFSMEKVLPKGVVLNEVFGMKITLDISIRRGKVYLLV